MNESSPLVSVRVITYNSAPYVIETLESVKNQTYQNIELIVSDDCSTDDTIAICNEWINKNRNRFVRTKLITFDKNTGLTKNSNRSIKASNGTWLKGIGGDDALAPDCIERNIQFVLANPKARIVHSSMKYYQDTFAIEDYIKTRDLSHLKITEKSITAQEQFNLLLYGCTINTPSLFVHHEIFKEYGMFDEDIISIEDWPFYLKLTKGGCKIDYFNYPTILYRVRSNSLCNERTYNTLFNQHFRREKPIFEKYIKANANVLHKNLLTYRFFILNAFDKLNLNKRTRITKFLFLVFLSPYILYDMRVKNKRLSK